MRFTVVDSGASERCVDNRLISGLRQQVGIYTELKIPRGAIAIFRNQPGYMGQRWEYCICSSRTPVEKICPQRFRSPVYSPSILCNGAEKGVLPHYIWIPKAQAKGRSHPAACTRSSTHTRSEMTGSSTNINFDCKNRRWFGSA